MAAKKKSTKKKTITVSQGPVSIQVAAELAPAKGAGTMSPDQLRRLAPARKGVGLALESAADVMEDLGDEFMAPRGVTPEKLREAAAKADGGDAVLASIDTLREVYRQSNLIWDAEAAALLIKLNDQVKAQAKGNKKLRVAFREVTRYFRNDKPEKKRAAGPA